jgi:hypothetical protein
MSRRGTVGRVGHIGDMSHGQQMLRGDLSFLADRDDWIRRSVPESLVAETKDLAR